MNAMGTRDWSGIFFLLDGHEYAFRAWQRVPSVSDWVVFAPDEKPFEVERVIWREEKSDPGNPYAEVVIKRVTR
jgi:hypothetical protein